MRLNDQEVEIICALADNDLKVTTTARKLKYHRNTVVYHLEQIKKRTGLNPSRFHDLRELLDQLKEDDHEPT